MRNEKIFLFLYIFCYIFFFLKPPVPCPYIYCVPYYFDESIWWRWLTWPTILTGIREWATGKSNNMLSSSPSLSQMSILAVYNNVLIEEKKSNEAAARHRFWIELTEIIPYVVIYMFYIVINIILILTFVIWTNN